MSTPGELVLTQAAGCSIYRDDSSDSLNSLEDRDTTFVSSVSPGTIALLDIDHTLSFNEGEYNLSLLEALRRQRIRDVYLFTDMIFDARTMENRRLLLERMAQEGFVCHGVITPSDLAWQDVPVDEALAFEDDVFRNYRGKFSGEAFNTFLASRFEIIPPRYPHIQAFLATDYELKGTPGAAYDEAQKGAQQGAVQQKSNVCKILSGLKLEQLQAQRPQLTHDKCLMLMLFLRNKPEWVQRIVVADDNAQVLETMHAMKSDLAVPMAIVTVNGNRTPAENYQQMMRDVIPTSPLKDALLQKITTYLTWRADKSHDDGRGYRLGLFTRVRHAGSFGRIRAEGLLSRLRIAHPDDVAVIIRTHLSDPRSTLHNHSLDSYVLEAVCEHLNEFDIDGRQQPVQSLRNSASREALRNQVLDESALHTFVSV